MMHHTRTVASSLTLSFQTVATSLNSVLTLTKQRMKMKLEQTAKQ